MVDRLTQYIQQTLGDHDAARIGLKPFMPLEHYKKHFEFLPYIRPSDSIYPKQTWDLHYWLFELYKYQFGFTLPSEELMEHLVKFLRENIGLHSRVLDAGSGSGFISKELCRRGVDAFAVDNREIEKIHHDPDYPPIDVHRRDVLGEAVEFVSSKFGAVLLIWPPFATPFALEIARAMHAGQFLVFEGEHEGGCNADDDFFTYLSDENFWTPLKTQSDQLNALHVTFATQHDHWSIWKKVA